MNIIENPTIGQILEMKKFDQFKFLDKTWTIIRNEVSQIDGRSVQKVYFTHHEYKHEPFETFNNLWTLVSEEGQTFGKLYLPVISTLNAKCIKEVSFSTIFKKLLWYHKEETSLFEQFPKWSDI